MNHWRKFHETEFLGAFDLEMQNVTEAVLKIETVSSKSVKDDKGRSETVLTCEFEGVDKPMILNATNCKAIEKVAQTPYIENWKGTEVTLYIQKGIKAFGKVVDGLRIRDFKPVPQADPKEIENEIAIIQNCSTLDELKEVYTKSKHKNNPKVIKAKDELKNVLAK